MAFVRTERFKRAYRRLEQDNRERVIEALAQLRTDRTHPGLRIKRMQGKARIGEMWAW